MQARNTSSLERRYKKARDKVQAQTKKFEKSKKAYLTAMFEIERKAIKVKLAINTDIASTAILEIQHLSSKAAKLKEICLARIEKWLIKLNLFLAVAKERANADSGNVMETIRKAVIDKTSDGDGNGGINIEKLLEKENIREPVFEEYVPAGNKNEMFDPCFPENMSASEDWGYESDSSVTYCEKEANFIEGRQLSKDWKSHLYAVIKDYKRQKFDELNLKTGEKVKQILSADKSGMAFGIRKSGIVRKKKGFYPVSHVCKVKDPENARDTRTSKKEKSTRQNPVSRIIDTVMEPKTKFALLTEVASDDVTKVYTEKKRQKRKIFTMKNWLKIYGIEFDEDETCYSVHGGKKAPLTPAKVNVAKTISSEKCTFVRRQECNEAGYYPSQIQYSISTPKHGGEVELEDIESTSEQRTTLSKE